MKHPFDNRAELKVAVKPLTSSISPLVGGLLLSVIILLVGGTAYGY